MNGAKFSVSLHNITGAQNRMAVQFYIFLTSTVFGVERSRVRLCLFTPLYPTDSKLGILTTYTDLLTTAEVSADVRNRLSPYHKETKNFINSSSGEHRQKMFENTVARYVIQCFHGSNIFWSVPHESKISFWRVLSFRKNHNTFILYSQNRSTTLVCNVGTPGPFTRHHNSYDCNVTATNSFSQQILTDSSSKIVYVGTLVANLCFL
jgi:hypothetical protein